MNPQGVQPVVGICLMCRDHTSQDAVNKGWSAWGLRAVGLTNAMPQLSALSPIQIVMALEDRKVRSGMAYPTKEF